MIRKQPGIKFLKSPIIIYHKRRPVWPLLLCRRRSSPPSVGWRLRCGEYWRPSSRPGRLRGTLVTWWCFSTQSSARRRTSRNSPALSSDSSSKRHYFFWLWGTNSLTIGTIFSMSCLHIWFSKLKWSLDVLLRFYERHSFVCALHKV